MGEQLTLESVGPRAGLRVISVWYLQPTARHEDLGKASVRIGTNLGEYYRDVDFSPEGLRQAQLVARGCGVDLMIAHDLRDVVALWEADHG